MEILEVDHSEAKAGHCYRESLGLFRSPLLPWEHASSIVSDAIPGPRVEVWVDNVKPSRTVAYIGLYLVPIQVLIYDFLVLFVVFLGKNY